MQKIKAFYALVISPLVSSSYDDVYVGTDFYDPGIYKRHRSFCESKRHDYKKLLEKNRKLQNFLRLLEEKIGSQQTESLKSEDRQKFIHALLHPKTNYTSSFWETLKTEHGLTKSSDDVEPTQRHTFYNEIPRTDSVKKSKEPVSKKWRAYEQLVSLNRTANKWKLMAQEYKPYSQKEEKPLCKKNKIKRNAHHQKQPNKRSKR